MCRFSIIVPFVQPYCSFDDTLASVLRYRPRNSIVVVVHDGTYQDPHDLSDEIELIIAAAPASRSSCLSDFLSAGVTQAEGQITVWIRPGVELDEGWESKLFVEFSDPFVASVSPIVFDRNAPTKVVAAGVAAERTGNRKISGVSQRVAKFRRNFEQPVGPTSWLAAWRTKTLQSILPLSDGLRDVYLDLEIGLSLNRAGFRTALSNSFVGLVDDPDLILGELGMPHGDCAQRGVQKFLSNGRFELIAGIINDLIRIPAGIWRLKHALQRLNVSKYHRSDFEQINRLDCVRSAHEAAEIKGSSRRAA